MIDLKNNKLIIGTTGGETEFLHENELPPSAHHPTDQTSTDDGHLDRAIADSLRDQAKAAHSSSASTLSTASGPSPRPTAAASSEDEIKIQKLVSMGFQRDSVVDALKQTNGNVDQAASVLIVKSLPPPPHAPKK